MKHYEVPTRVLSAVLAMLVVAGACSMALAVPNNYIGPDMGDWNTASNWSQTFVPDYLNNEAAVISDNDTVLLNAAAVSDAAGVRLGTIAGSFGGLRIGNGGTLNNFVGALTPVEPGTIQVGTVGRGTLTVLGGGTLTGTGLSSGGDTASSITLGDATGSTASLTIDGTSNLQRTTTIVGPNVNFSSSGNLTLASAHTLLGEIRNATNHSPLKSGGTASVNGTFKPTFVGVVPALGNKWNIIDATTISGAFSAIDTSMAPALPAGQGYQMIQANGGMNGRLLQLSIEEVLTLNVNRTTGNLTIANQGATAKKIEGYSVLSGLGALNPTTWNSLQDQGVAGWVESGPTANNLSELNTLHANNIAAIPGGGTLNLGAGFVGAFPAFGQNPDDVTFEYLHTDGRIIQGSVNYVGGKVVNDLILTVNPANGQVNLKNDSPYDVFIDGYAVRSTAGSLVPGTWSSLQDQGVSGWLEAGNPNPTANVVTELKADGVLRLTAGSGYNLGTLAKSIAGGLVQDLTFEFLQQGSQVATDGQVFYGALPSVAAPTPGGVLGDYNNNGTVDAADFVLWRNVQGTNTVLRNDPIGGTIGAAHYTQWRANFGRTAAPGAGASLAAVPEPATAVMLLVTALLGFVSVRQSRG